MWFWVMLRENVAVFKASPCPSQWQHYASPDPVATVHLLLLPLVLSEMWKLETGLTLKGYNESSTRDLLIARERDVLDFYNAFKHEIHESINQTEAQKPEAEFKGGAHGPASNQNQRTDSTKPGVQTFDVAVVVGKRRFSQAKLRTPPLPRAFSVKPVVFSLFLARELQRECGE
ncbi:hypothetical protein WN943_014273 [Citrus x changshan-huyou]